MTTVHTNGATTASDAIAPQAEVYRGIQIHHDQRGYWFATPRGKVERSQNIERIRRSIDIVLMVLDTASACHSRDGCRS